MKMKHWVLGLAWGLAIFSSAQAAQYSNSESVSVQPQRGMQETFWGVEIAGSGLGVAPKLSGVATGKSISNFSMNAEVQPPLSSASIGEINIGPSFSTFSSQGAGPNEVPRSLVFAWTVGAGARYQARFLSDQWIVPMVSYNLESFQYRLRSGETGQFFTKGPTLGAYFLLNSFDPEAAHALHSGTGIARTYATFEYRAVSGSGSDMELDGRSAHFGLRVEF